MDNEEQSPDPVIEWYIAGIDRTMIRENLRRTPEERLLALEQLEPMRSESVPRQRHWMESRLLHCR